jgi:outer membrane protein W
MKMKLFAITPVLLMFPFAAALHGQAAPQASKGGMFSRLGASDVGVAAAGQFTTSVTNQQIGGAGEVLPHQTTTDSPGVLFTIHIQPASWAGLEFNYQYTKLSERFFRAPIPQGAVYNPTLNAPVNVTTSFHEATGAYVLHLKPHKRISPYVGLGGGYLDFVPTQVDSNQWRGTGLLDIGVNMQTDSRLGFRFGARDLVYRAPDYFDASLSSSRWVSTEEPYAGVYVKF